MQSIIKYCYPVEWDLFKSLIELFGVLPCTSNEGADVESDDLLVSAPAPADVELELVSFFLASAWFILREITASFEINHHYFLFFIYTDIHILYDRLLGMIVCAAAFFQELAFREICKKRIIQQNLEGHNS